MWSFFEKIKNNALTAILTVAIVLLLGMNIYEKINNNNLANTVDDLQSIIRSELTDQRNELGAGITELGASIDSTRLIYTSVESQLDRIEEGNSDIILTVGGIQKSIDDSIGTVGRTGEIADTIQDNTDELERANLEARDTIRRLIEEIQQAEGDS